jgi:hypothetical protein
MRFRHMFAAKIEDFADIWGLQSFNDTLYIYDRFDLIAQKNNQRQSILRRKGLDGFFIEEQGLWIYVDNTNDIHCHSEFIDLFNNGLSLMNLPFEIHDTRRTVSRLLLHADGDCLYVIDTRSNGIRKHDGNFHPGVVATSDWIVVRDREKGLLCLDYDFQELWKIPFEKRCYADAFSAPQNFKDLIILNVGEIQEMPRGEFELNAYRIEDGLLAWQLILPTTPNCSNVMGDKIYISVKDRILVVAAASGKVLVDVPHQLGNDHKHFLYPYKDILIAASETAAKINVFSKDGQKLLQEIGIPDPLSVLAHRLPVECEGKLYILLSPRNMLVRETSSALLELTPDASQPAKLTPELPPRPPFVVSRLTKKNGEHEHLITVSHANLDEIILYGMILIKQIIVEVASVVFVRKRDLKHNGTLHFVVDPDPLPKSALAGAREKLQVIADRTAWYTKRMRYTAGKLKREFNVLIDIK